MVLPDVPKVQPLCISTFTHQDSMEITENTQQVTTQNLAPIESKVRAARTQAIQVIRHLMGMMERNEALNKPNQNELNLLQQKVDEKD